MKLKKIFGLLTVAFAALSLTSCLGSDDNGGVSGYVSGSDFADVDGYSTNRVTFTVDTEAGGTVILYAEQNGKIDPEKFPAGSRVYLTYQMTLGQDLTLPVKVDIMSTVGVTTVRSSQGTEEDCKLDYPSFVVNKIYRTGDYVNMLVQVRKDPNRTWHCYAAPNSTGEEVDLYLVTEAPAAENSGTTLALSVDVSQYLGQYKKIRFHVNNQERENYVYSFPTSSNSNNQ